MAGIFADIGNDVQKLQKLRAEINKIKEALKGINVHVDVDIAKDMEAQLKSLMGQYDELIRKVSESEGKIKISSQNITEAANKVIQAQERMSSAASSQTSSPSGQVPGNSQAMNSNTDAVKEQAKAYDELKGHIEDYLGTMSGNARFLADINIRMKTISSNVKVLNKAIESQGYATDKQAEQLARYNAELAELRIQAQDARRELNAGIKINMSGEGSLKQLQAELAQMQRTWAAMTETQRNSPFGKEFAASIEQANAKVSELEQTMGRYQRNVGNYASGWNGLNMSIQQIGRELPSLAMGWNTFFLAISNNLPILTDEIKRAREEYDLLKKSGKAATPVWKQIVSSLLSWQTALTVGITLLTMYGKEIMGWVSGLFSAKKGIDSAAESTKALSSAMLEGSKNAQSELTTLNLLYNAATDLSKGMDERTKAVEELQKRYPDYLGNISQEDILAGKAASSYSKLAKSIIESAKARAMQDKMVENEKKRLELAEKIAEAQEKYNKASQDAAKIAKSYQSALESGADPTGAQGRLMTAYKQREDSAKKALDDLQKEYDSLGKVNENLANQINVEDLFFDPTSSSSDKGKKEIETKVKDYLSEIEQLRKDNEDRNVELMEEGTEKQLAEIDNRYSRMREKVKTLEDELRKQQGGNLTQSQQLTFSVAYKQIGDLQTRDKDAVNKAQIDVNKAQIEKEREAMNEYLKEYGTFQQKRLAITEEYNQKIQKALSENNMGEALAFTQERNRLLSSLDKEKAFEGIEKAFGNISNLSGKAIDSLIDNLKKYKKEAIDTFDVSDIDRYEKALSRLEDAKLENKFSVFSNFIPDFYREQIKLEEEFNQAQETSIELGQKQAELEKEILEYIEKQTGKKFKKEDLYSTEGINGIAGLLSGKGGDSLSIFTEMKSALDSVSAASGNAGQKMSALFNMKGGSGGGASAVAIIDTIVHGINDLVQGLNDMANEIKDTMEALGRNTDIDSGIGKFAEGMSMFAEASQGATDAWDSLKSGNIGGVLAGVTKSFTAWIKGFAGIHDKKNEKRIQQLQEQVDTLTDSYDKLGRAVEDAYSKDASGLIEDQNKLLEQQKLLIEQQIREEQDKKNTDDERIKEWQRQIEEINQTIEDNKEKMADAIFGEDVQTAIENFVSAYTEAWAGTEDRAESAKDQVKRIMQSMVTESIKSFIQASGSMEEIRQKLKEFYTDNVLTGWEQDYIYNMAEELQKEIDRQFGWAEGLFKENEAKEQQSATSKGFETMTQDQADELNGRFTAVAETNMRIESAVLQQGTSIVDLKGSVDNLTSQVVGMYNIADETRTIIANSYLELQQISENTGEIITPIKKIQKDIEEVKNNTSRL